MHRSIGMLSILFIVFFATAEVRAEVYIDLYAGSAKTNKGKSDISGGFGTSGDIEYDSSFTAGGRVGGWFLKYFGVGLDVFHFNSDPKNSALEQSNWGVGLDFMGRLPLLVNETMPNGRLQPYLTVGPAIFISTLDFPGFTTEEGSSRSVGFKGGAGLKFLFTPNVGLFGEYRYTDFHSKDNLRNGPVTGEMTQHIGTHHFVGGFSIHF